MPSNADLISLLTPKETRRLLPILRRKNTRALSGVTVIAVMTKPYPCPKPEPPGPGADDAPSPVQTPRQDGCGGRCNWPRPGAIALRQRGKQAQDAEIPDFARVHANDARGALRQHQRHQHAEGSDRAIRRDQNGSDVEEDGVHVKTG